MQRSHPHQGLLATCRLAQGLLRGLPFIIARRLRYPACALVLHPRPACWPSAVRYCPLAHPETTCRAETYAAGDLIAQGKRFSCPRRLGFRALNSGPKTIFKLLQAFMQVHRPPKGLANIFISWQITTTFFFSADDAMLAQRTRTVKRGRREP